MAEKRKLKDLSKRAQELLKEIRGEPATSDIKKTVEKDITDDEEIKKPLTFDRLLQGKDFDPMLYRKLSTSNKLPSWLLGIFVLVVLTIAIAFHMLSVSKEKFQKYTQLEMEIPKLKQQLKILEKQNKLSDEELKAQSIKFNTLKETFPNLKKTQNYIDDIIRLFEVAHLTILNQEINFQKNETSLDLSEIPILKPDQQSSIFLQNLNVQGTPKSTVEKKPSNLKNVINTIAKTNSNTKSNISRNINRSLPEISFLSMKLTIKGTYPNYLLARNTLTRILPSVSIPLEEMIVTSKSEIEIRVIFDIPFLNNITN